MRAAHWLWDRVDAAVLNVVDRACLVALVASEIARDKVARARAARRPAEASRCTHPDDRRRYYAVHGGRGEVEWCEHCGSFRGIAAGALWETPRASWGRL